MYVFMQKKPEKGVMSITYDVTFPNLAVQCCAACACCDSFLLFFLLSWVLLLTLVLEWADPSPLPSCSTKKDDSIYIQYMSSIETYFVEIDSLQFTTHFLAIHCNKQKREHKRKKPHEECSSCLQMYIHAILRVLTILLQKLSLSLLCLMSNKTICRYNKCIDITCAVLMCVNRSYQLFGCTVWLKSYIFYYISSSFFLCIVQECAGVTLGFKSFCWEPRSFTKQNDGFTLKREQQLLLCHRIMVYQ